MGVFNLLETFFFISLAITFVLIMMLVYHFKGRILIIEQKCDTMFEIMNNMVKEMKNIKYNAATYPSQYMFQSNAETMFNSQTLFNPEMILPNNESIYFTHNNSTLEEVDDDDNEDDSDNSDADSVVESEFAKIIVSDNEDDNFTPIKIINVAMNDDENVEIIKDTINYTDADIDIDEIEDTISLNEGGEGGEEIRSEGGEEIRSEDRGLTVNKVDITVLPEESDSEYLEKSDSVDYRKMDVSYLRTMVITRGLVSDTKKLKKPDLIRILEDAEMDTHN